MSYIDTGYAANPVDQLFIEGHKEVADKACNAAFVVSRF